MVAAAAVAAAAVSNGGSSGAGVESVAVGRGKRAAPREAVSPSRAASRAAGTPARAWGWDETQGGAGAARQGGGDGGGNGGASGLGGESGSTCSRTTPRALRVTEAGQARLVGRTRKEGVRCVGVRPSATASLGLQNLRDQGATRWESLAHTYLRVWGGAREAKTVGLAISVGRGEMGHRLPPSLGTQKAQLPCNGRSERREITPKM